METAITPNSTTGRTNRQHDLATARAADPGPIGGSTKIADTVVSRIAGLATREIPGVHDMTATGIGQAFGGIATRVTGQEQMDKGVVVQVGEIECIVDLNS